MASATMVNATKDVSKLGRERHEDGWRWTLFVWKVMMMPTLCSRSGSDDAGWMTIARSELTGNAAYRNLGSMCGRGTGQAISGFVC